LKQQNQELVVGDDQIKIFIGSTVNPVTNNMAYCEFGAKGYIAYAHMNDLMFYDIEKEVLFRKLRYPTKGPNGIGHLNNFHIESFDSIYILNMTQLLISDSSATIKKRIDISDITINSYPIGSPPFLYQYNLRIVNNHGRLNIPATFVDIDVSNNLSAMPLEFAYDIKRDSLFYPKRWYPPVEGKPYYSRDYGNNKWCYSFFKDHNIYVMDGNNEIQSHFCKSKYAPKKFAQRPIANDMMESVILSIETPQYWSIVYDKWRKLYYRFYKTGEVVPKNMEMDYYWALKDNQSIFSVIIMNENFEIIGETLMEKNLYNPFMYFVNESGLHFALHVNHPEFDPDYLKFARFTVEPAKQ
jgi:hypothetical protein